MPVVCFIRHSFSADDSPSFRIISVVRGGFPSQFPKCFCKKAEIVKPAGLCHRGNLLLCGSKKVRRLLDAILSEILVWCPPDGAAETAKAFTFTDGSAFGNFRNRDFFRIVLMDKLQHGFDPLRIPLRFGIYICITSRLVVIEQLDHTGKRLPHAELISHRLLIHSLPDRLNIVYDLGLPGNFRRKKQASADPVFH